MPCLNWQKFKQILSNILRINFSYLKNIHIFHSHYHPKIIGHIQKIKQKRKCVSTHEITQLIITKMKMKMKDTIDTTKIDLDLDMDTNIANIKSFFVSWCLYVLSNNYAKFEAQFMKKLSNTKTELKKSLAYKKGVVDWLN